MEKVQEEPKRTAHAAELWETATDAAVDAEREVRGAGDWLLTSRWR